MIELSRPQLSFAEGLIQQEVEPLWEPWMRQVDEVLADRELVQIVYAALAQRWPKSRTRGRPGTPADIVLRLLLLKHMRNWTSVCSSARCARTWCIGSSPESRPRRCPMRRLWVGWPWRWVRRSSSRFTPVSSPLPARGASFTAADALGCHGRGD